jgi:predicted nucleotidyltransferase
MRSGKFIQPEMSFMQKEIRTLLGELKEALHHSYGNNLVGLYLYGSYAREEEDPESDLDIAIVLKDFKDYWREIQRTSKIISELSLKYSVTISPVRIRKDNWASEDSPFLNNLRKESIAI